ncbi:MAG: Cytochrome P450 monooxygenase orf9 [Pleopsidium flavum]|nr:MAG: Cytochrome P450 monooxygenase orf9 [Pleopsidium flavum]
MGGRFHRAIANQHQRYGPVFRVSPNELSFASVGSWKDIYGHPPSGKATHVKSEFYEMYGSGYKSLCIGSERNPKKHSAMKKNLSAAFSTRALLEQESIIDGCVDAFVEKIANAKDSRGKGLNMTKWYEMISFDILGEMAFGESFRGVENEKPHFWSELILSHLFFITVLDNLRRYPLFVSIGKLILPFATTAVRDKHSGYTRNQVEKRLNMVSARKDFLSNLIGKVAIGEVDQEELTAHVSTLVIAGGETTSTFLGAVTYHLLKSPKAYDKLQREIRGTFQTYEDINASAAQQLPYLQAVIAEGLRIYPPGSQGFPRLSPGAFVDGFWVPEGSEIYTSAWTVTHDPQYFHDPLSFKPERWIDPGCTDVKEASQPFSLGPRGCLGRNFAFVEMNLLLAKMHWRLDLKLANKGLDWEGESHMHVMWWKPELYVRILPRQGIQEGPDDEVTSKTSVTLK